MKKILCTKAMVRFLVFDQVTDLMGKPHIFNVSRTFSSWVRESPMKGEFSNPSVMEVARKDDFELRMFTLKDNSLLPLSIYNGDEPFEISKRKLGGIDQEVKVRASSVRFTDKHS